jgi:hypothetical protein
MTFASRFIRNIFFRKIPYIIITAFWLFTMTILIIRHYSPDSTKLTPSEITLPGELYEETWMGAYFNGEKIGYSYRKITSFKYGYRISEILKVQLKIMGVVKDIDTKVDADVDHLFRLLFFFFRLKSDISTEIKGMVEGKNLLVTIHAGGLTSKQSIPLRETPYLSLSIIPNILRKGLKSGDTMSIPVIDPSTLSQEYMEVKVVGREPIMSMGERRDAFRIKVVFKGIETYMWLTEKGEVLREESPEGFTLVKETKENAIQPGKPSIDLIAQVAIPFNMKLPEGVDYLKVRLSGVDPKGFELDGGRQTFKGEILEIRKESPGPRIRYQESGVPDEYLKDTVFIQSKDPAIVSLAKDIVRDEKDALRKARLIYEWVYKNIQKAPVISLPMATEVLRTRQGDCNEHTTLFTALARAAGIPTRIAVGLTYKDGFFYYHAWPEVYLNEWVAVDPTLGQFPADAAHIRFLTGDIDKQLKLVSVIGKLRLDGIEYR